MNARRHGVARAPWARLLGIPRPRSEPVALDRIRRRLGRLCGTSDRLGTGGGGAGRLVLHLRRTHQEAVGLDDFSPLDSLSGFYGIADLVGARTDFSPCLLPWACAGAAGRVELRA